MSLSPQSLFLPVFSSTLPLIGSSLGALLSSLSLTLSLLDFQAVRYIELLPPEKRPVAGTEGANYRRQQMARQLPEHDQDPSKCHELSPAEVKQMQQYIRKYKDEALGVGDVMLPEEMALVQAGGQGGLGAGGAPGGTGAAFVPGVGAPGAPVDGSGGPQPAGFGAGRGGAGVGPGSVAGLGPGAQIAGASPGGAGPLSGSGVGPSAGFGPAGGATGTTATAGAMSVPGAQQAGRPQQTFVSTSLNSQSCDRQTPSGPVMSACPDAGLKWTLSENKKFCVTLGQDTRWSHKTSSD